MPPVPPRLSGVVTTPSPTTTMPWSPPVTVLPRPIVAELVSELSNPMKMPVELSVIVLPTNVASVPPPKKVVTRNAAEVEPSLDATPRLSLTVLSVTAIVAPALMSST